MTAIAKQLDPRVITLWRLQRIVRLTVVSAPFALIMGVLIAQSVSVAVGLVAGVGWVAVHAVLAVVWPPLAYRAFRYRVRAEDLMVESGVLFHRWSCIPFRRIQHVDTRQGPLERLFGLQRLAVYTAAGMNADGSIPGLQASIAEHLRDELSRRGGDDGV